MNSTLTWMGLSANQEHDPNCTVREELDASDCRKVYQTVAKKMYSGESGTARMARQGQFKKTLKSGYLTGKHSECVRATVKGNCHLHRAYKINRSIKIYRADCDKSLQNCSLYV
jgi:hypothetical protein